MLKYSSMLRLGIAAFALATLAAWAHPEGFTFTIGNPVASQDFHFKTAAFVFRTESCADPAKAQISATAEGIVKGARQSVALKVMAASKPGVYAVNQSWPAEGEWVVSLRGTCGSESAGAIVPMGPKGFIRESSKFFARPATDAEIDASLKAMAHGDNQGDRK
jgi:hypothetical protein